MNATLVYIKNMGAQTSPGKSHLFAADKEDEKELAETIWDVTKVKMDVVRKFRYLGAQVTSRGKLAAEEQDKRFQRATVMASRLAKMHIGVKEKAKTIMTKINPRAFYGAECANPNEKHIAAYTTQVLKNI